jgi:hypothetical protein
VVRLGIRSACWSNAVAGLLVVHMLLGREYARWSGGLEPVHAMDSI